MLDTAPEQVEAGGTKPRIDLVAVSFVSGDQLRRATVDELRDDETRRGAFEQAVLDGSTIWVDLSLELPALRWVEPWSSQREVKVDWTAFGPIEAVLRRSGRYSAQLQTVLHALPHLNELGVARALRRELPEDCSARPLFPLIGFIPTSTLDDADSPPTQANANEGETLEFVLLRVNLGVVDNAVFTVRLPDRLCSGARTNEGAGRRISARGIGKQLPKLTGLPDLLPSGRGPHADELADALVLYLSATTVCLAEFARRAMLRIESEVRNALKREDVSDGNGPLSGYSEVIDLRVTLQVAEEEMRRLLQRLSEVDVESDAGLRVREAYSRALEEICSLQQELRLTADGLETKLEERRQQSAIARHNNLQALIAALGALLVLPALVATIFDENAKLPEGDPVGLAAMVFWMLGLALLGWLFIVWLLWQGDAPKEAGLGWLDRQRARSGGLLAVALGAVALGLSYLT